MQEACSGASDTEAQVEAAALARHAVIEKQRSDATASAVAQLLQNTPPTAARSKVHSKLGKCMQ